MSSSLNDHNRNLSSTPSLEDNVLDQVSSYPNQIIDEKVNIKKFIIFYLLKFTLNNYLLLKEAL